MDPTTVSWVLYALRAVLGYEHVRAAVLKRYVGHLPDVTLGRTFAGVYRYRELTGYLTNQLRTPGKVLFTACNTGDYVTSSSQTHYQTYILDNTTRVLTVIDPARRARGPGIYRPIITQNVVAPFMTLAGYCTVWLKTENACQANPQDVFCQSWSLYLQIRGVLSAGGCVPVPRAQDAKYSVLLAFYQELCDLSVVCYELRREYAEVISTHPDLVIGGPKHERAPLRASFRQVDPCMVLCAMTSQDMFDNKL